MDYQNYGYTPFQNNQNTNAASEEQIQGFNNAIALEEGKINEIYYHIGKLYAKSHSDALYPNITPYINDLNICQQNIENYKDEINRIKGIAICKNCGCEIGINMMYCFMCGTAVNAPVAQSSQPEAPQEETAQPPLAQPEDVQPVVAPAFVPTEQPPIEPQSNLEPFPPAQPPQFEGVTPEASFDYAAQNDDAQSPQSDFISREETSDAYSPQSPKDDDNFVICPLCANHVSSSYSFCLYCGAPLSDNSNANQPIEENNVSNYDAYMTVDASSLQNPYAKDTEETALLSNQCPNCGYAVPDDMMFCQECGTKVR